MSLWLKLELLHRASHFSGVGCKERNEINRKGRGEECTWKPDLLSKLRHRGNFWHGAEYRAAVWKEQWSFLHPLVPLPSSHWTKISFLDCSLVYLNIKFEQRRKFISCLYKLCYRRCWQWLSRTLMSLSLWFLSEGCHSLCLHCGHQSLCLAAV